MKTLISIFLSLLMVTNVHANESLINTIKKIKPSVVGVGIYTPTGRPQNVLLGTGFIVGEGLHVVTNFHVVSKELDLALRQQLVVFIGVGKRPEKRHATLVAKSEQHDLAVLKITGQPVNALTLSDSTFIDEGSEVAFTGYPIGAVLGLYPVTHRGIISSITPTITPVDDASQISIKMLESLRNPYLVYQLDATAYPGNSGSALYDIKTGNVVAVINKVFVQQSKEAVISNPSGITYAIPVKYVRQLLKENDIKG